MISASIAIDNIKGVTKLIAAFDFSCRKIIVITGKNGTGKTTLVKAFKLISDPQVFQKSAGLNSIRSDSNVLFELDGHRSFSFSFNPKLEALDAKQALPPKETVVSELPIPHGARFQQFSLVAKFDAEIRTNIASSNYRDANELQDFLHQVYLNNKFSNLKVTNIKKQKLYFILRESDYYIREDHLSSGEFFLIQLFRLITSGSELVIIDELDISLDASAQVHLFEAIKPLLDKHKSKLIVMSHSLAFMKTVNDGGLYYLEANNDSATLEQRSYGYVKSDLYGFKGKDRYILTEDETLSGFLAFLIKSEINPFFEYEIIAVGGQPQIETMAKKNDSDQIFGLPKNVLIVVDKDIYEKIDYRGPSEVHSSPVDDIELFIWENRERLLEDVNIDKFKHAKKAKATAKTYWKKVISSGQKTRDDLYGLVTNENKNETDQLVAYLKSHLCLV